MVEGPDELGPATTDGGDPAAVPPGAAAAAPAVTIVFAVGTLAALSGSTLVLLLMCVGPCPGTCSNSQQKQLTDLCSSYLAGVGNLTTIKLLVDKQLQVVGLQEKSHSFLI
jgi:hypothetical protein